MKAPEQPAAQAFLDFCLQQLLELGPVRTRAMFGGHGLYCHDIFFGMVYEGRLYFKTDAASRGRYHARGSRPFQPSVRQTLTSYYEVLPEVVADAELVCEWAADAVAVQRVAVAARRWR